MSKAIVFCEYANKSVKKGTLELLTLAKKSGCEVTAIAFGPDAGDITDSLAHFGANKVVVCKDEKLTNYNPESYSEVAAQIIKSEPPTFVFASSTVLARDMFPRVAAKLECGVISDCTEVEISGDTVNLRRPMYAGKCTAAVEFQNSSIKIILMRPNQLPVGEADTSNSANVEEFAMPAMDLKTLVKEVVKGASEKVDLTEANIIVSGGRGLKEAGNFKMLEELADVLGATVGASRAVCDAGWVPHSMQVGQTGKTVAPSLYIAVGISGAIQHLAGMSGSKVIVAINNDPEAPIFQKATYGIVGDAFEVVPKLKEEFQQLLSQ